MNLVLQSIKERRSILRFEKVSVEDEKVQAILDAGRWAPSWLNRQPWRFILIKDHNIKERLSELVPTVYNQGMKEAPLCIAVCVDISEDPFHYIEDGAVASQNMALAAHSLGLGSCWIGVFNLKKEKDSSEEKIKEVLEIPKEYRMISLLPIGIPKYAPEKNRKALSQLVYYDKFKP